MSILILHYLQLYKFTLTFTFKLNKYFDNTLLYIILIYIIYIL